MNNINKKKEIEIAQKTKSVSLEEIKKAVDNFLLIKNLCNIYQYLHEFFDKLEFNFNNEMKPIKEINLKMNTENSNFFEILNQSLEIDKKIIRFCNSSSAIYQFIENNLTIWKGKAHKIRLITR
jgi:hypothetical protein